MSFIKIVSELKRKGQAVTLTALLLSPLYFVYSQSGLIGEQICLHRFL